MRNILNEMNEDAKKIYDNTTKHIESSSLHEKIFTKDAINEVFNFQPEFYKVGKIEKKLFETRNSKMFNMKKTYLYRYHCKDENNDWKIFAVKAKTIKEADELMTEKMKNEGYTLKLKTIKEEKDIDPQDELSRGTSHSMKTLVYDIIPGTLASFITNLLYKSDVNNHFRNWGFNSGFSLGKITFNDKEVKIPLKAPNGTVYEYQITVKKK